MIYKEFLLRAAKNEDISSIINVVFKVLQEFDLSHSETGKDNDLNNIEESYFNNEGYFGVAVDRNSNKIIGTFGLYSINKNIFELRKMYLLKHVRRKGLGQSILTYAIQLARENIVQNYFGDYFFFKRSYIAV